MNQWLVVLLLSALFCCSYKTAEKLFLDAMDKIKAIGNEVTILLLLWSSCCFSTCFLVRIGGIAVSEVQLVQYDVLLCSWVYRSKNFHKFPVDKQIIVFIYTLFVGTW